MFSFYTYDGILRRMDCYDTLSSAMELRSKEEIAGLEKVGIDVENASFVQGLNIYWGNLVYEPETHACDLPYTDLDKPFNRKGNIR
jgi:hypothetical protein